MSKVFSYFTHYSRSIGAFANKIPKLNGKDIDDESLYFTSLINILPAIEHLLLRKYENDEYMAKDLNDLSMKELVKFKKERISNFSFYFSRNFYRFESLIDLMKFLELKCESYLKTSKTQERIALFEEFINLRQKEKVDKVTMVAGIFSAFFALLFSLPAIEAVTKLFHIKGYDLYIWMALIGVFLIIIGLVFKDDIKRVFRK